MVTCFQSHTNAQPLPGDRIDGEVVRHAIDAGSYAEAERLGTSWLAEVSAARGAESLEAASASDLLIEAQIRNGKANAEDLLARAERVVAVKEGILGSEHETVATSLHNLGSLRVERGELELAVRLNQRALAIRRHVLPSNVPALADSLDYVARPLIYLERFAEAEKYLTESKAIREAHADDQPMRLERTLYLEALLHRWDGNYPAATRALDRVFDILSAAGAQHPDAVAAWELRGDLAFLAGDAQKARAAWTEALTLGESRLGPEHPAIPRLLRVLALAARDSGNLAEAQQLVDRAVPMAERSLASCNQELPMLLNDVAAMALYDGRYDQARASYAEALARSERCLGPTQSLTATILFNTAELSFALGDLAEARQLYGRAVRAWEAGLGGSHPYVARGLDALADVVVASGQLDRAQRLLERALHIRRRALGDSHPDVAVTLLKLAGIAAQSGATAAALDRIDQALAIYRRGGVPQDPDYLASAIAQRASLEIRHGDLRAAQSDYAEALATRERIFGAQHPLTARARADLAIADFAVGRSTQALSFALDAEQVGRDHLRFTIRSLPERQALAYADKRPRGLDVALSIVAGDPAAQPAPVLDALIRSRGLILDELAARARSTQSESDPALVALNASVALTRQRFATLMLRSLKGDEPVPPAVLDESRRQKEQAERQLAEGSARARVEFSRASLGLDDVRRSLPPESCLVSYVRYLRTTLRTANGQPAVRFIPSYLAFVIASDSSDAIAVPLGPAATLDTLVQAWHFEASGRDGAASQDAYWTAAVPLRRRIWDPVAAHVGGASHVFIVPDGALNLVSFVALPTRGHQYLVETGPSIHLLTTERDLIPEEGTPGHGLLALGGPVYDLGRPSPPDHFDRSAGCAGAGLDRFTDLPGARAEASDVSRIWSRTSSVTDAADGRDILLLQGRDATKRAFLGGVAGRQIVHLATHGFFLSGSCGPSNATSRGVGGLTGTPAAIRAARDNPLLLSGLAFAGANHRAKTTNAPEDEGILTADEVASLNLRGTQWAVLSACDTGLGEIRAGEGVFGLRRAFQVAGVQTVIMSLWSVEDQSTRAWMRVLYENRLERHLSTADAVREASLRTLTERRSRGQSTHPFFWAGFVAAGDWH